MRPTALRGLGPGLCRALGQTSAEPMQRALSARATPMRGWRPLFLRVSGASVATGWCSGRHREGWFASKRCGWATRSLTAPCACVLEVSVALPLPLLAAGADPGLVFSKFLRLSTCRCSPPLPLPPPPHTQTTDATCGFPLAVHFDALPSSGAAQEFEVDVVACFLMPNRKVIRIRLSAPRAGESVLASLVRLRQGDVVHVLAELERGALRRDVCQVYDIVSVPETCAIKSATWQSSGMLVLGLTLGGILGVTFRDGEAGSGQPEEALLQQPVSALGAAEGGGLVGAFKSILPQLWQQQQQQQHQQQQQQQQLGPAGDAGASDINEHASDILAVASHNAGWVSLDGKGNLRLWGGSVKGQANAAQVLCDPHREKQQISNAKLCVLHNVAAASGGGALVIAVALEWQTGPDGASGLGGLGLGLGQVPAPRTWRVGIFSFGGAEARPGFQGEVDPLAAGLDDDAVQHSHVLVDLQFSAAPSVQGQSGHHCLGLNTMWRRRHDGATLLFTTLIPAAVSGNNRLPAPFAAGGGGLGLSAGGGSVSLRVSSSQDAKRAEYGKGDQAAAAAAGAAADRDPGPLMLQRIFAPGRFSTRTIVEVLVRDIPHEFQVLPGDEPAKSHDLASLVECVADKCARWGHREPLAAYREFLRLCEKRALSDEDCGGARLLAVRESSQGDKFQTFLAHRDGLSIVAEAPSLAAGDSSTPSSVGSRLVRFAKDGPRKKRLSELCAAVSRRLHDKSVIDVQLFQDVEQVFGEIADEAVRDPATQFALGELEAFVQLAAARQNAATFDNPQLLSEAWAADPSGEVGTLFSAADLHVLVADVARSAVRSVLLDSQIDAIAFAIYQRVAPPQRAAEATKGSRKALCNFVYASFLLWLDTVRLTSDDELRLCIDLDGVHPSSLLLSSTTSATDSSRGGPGTSIGSESVFAHFWSKGRLSLRYALDPFDAPANGMAAWFDTCSRRCLFALRPSSMGDLVTHLVRHRQYACVRRLASFLSASWVDSSGQQLAVSGPSWAPLLQFSLCLAKSRVQCLESLASFCECLRRQAQSTASQRKTRGGAAGGFDEALPEGENKKFLDAFSGILQAAPSEREETNLSIDQLENSAAAGASSQSLEALFKHPELQGLQDTAALDALHCAQDALRKMLRDRSSPFSFVLDKRQGLVSAQFLSDAFVQNLSRCAYLGDVVDIFRRARGVLPTALGSQICVLGGEWHNTALQGIKDACAGSKRGLQACLGSADLATKNRIFNAALEGLNFDEAWRAVLEMLELEDPAEVRAQGGVAQWQMCLRSLVSLACDTGHLGWLCALPDELRRPPGLQGAAGQVWLADEVVRELERLAKSSGIDGTLVASGPGPGAGGNVHVGAPKTTISYYECLFAFLLSRGCHVEAARAMLSFSAREDNLSPSLRAR